MKSVINVYFSDFYSVSRETIEEYGAFNISLINDLPLFIDPFLLFNSDNNSYRKLHDVIIDYLVFLKQKVTQFVNLPKGMLTSWFMFPEVKQAWLGFCQNGNSGSGLGMDFAVALSDALKYIFTDFGKETITAGSHFEKVCLIKEGVGRDNISDFTANLIKEYLCEYTQAFAKKYLAPKFCKEFHVDKVCFNFATETWEARKIYLPEFQGDYVLLTPSDILRREDTWINRLDMLENFEKIPPSIPDDSLRFQVNNYFYGQLSKKAKKDEKREVALDTIKHFPVIIDYFVKMKEDSGESAVSVSEVEVAEVNKIFHQQVKELIKRLLSTTEFYNTPKDTYEDAMKRVMYLKHVIEDNDGYKIFYVDGKPIKRETDLHVMYRLVCYGSVNDVNSEVNNGRGPVDFKHSNGSKDSTLVEFKLASNSKIRSNLQKQVEIYEKANATNKSIKVILYFTISEMTKVQKLLNELGFQNKLNIILIDARNDNKPSASVANDTL